MTHERLDKFVTEAALKLLGNPEFVSAVYQRKEASNMDELADAVASVALKTGKLIIKDP